MRGYVNAVRAVVGLFALTTLRGPPRDDLLAPQQDRAHRRPAADNRHRLLRGVSNGVRPISRRVAWLGHVRAAAGRVEDGTIWIRTEASFISKNEEYLVLPPAGCAAPRSLLLPLDASVEDARGHLFITSGYVDDVPTIDTWRY